METQNLFLCLASRLKTVTALAKVNLTRSRCPPEEPIPGVKDDQLCTSEWSDMNMCSVGELFLNYIK